MPVGDAGADGAMSTATQRHATALLWLLSVLAAGLVGYFACFPLMDTDIWWHLAAGRLMVAEHRFIFRDPFAADVLGTSWLDVHWLFQVMAYLVHQAGGVAALVVAKVVVLGVGVAVGVRSLGARLPRWLWLPAGIAVAGFLYPARHLMLVRPTILTLVLLSTMLLLVAHVRRTGRTRALLLLLPVQVLWANLQGLFLLGPAVLLGFVLADAASALLLARVPGLGLEPPPARPVAVRLGIMVPLLVLAAALTPYGIEGLWLPFKLLGRIDSLSGRIFSREVSENLAPWLLERGSPQALFAWKWLAALTFLSFLPTVRRGLRLADLGLVVLFFALALTANRNVLLFLWVGGPICVQNLARRFAPSAPPAAGRSRRGSWLRRGLLLGAAVAFVLLARARLQEARGEPALTELAPFRVPVEAVDRLLAYGAPRGPIFCTDRYGGYLAWRRFPDGRPTMDGRLVLRTAAAYAEHLALGEHPEGFASYRQRHGIETAILPTAYPDRFLPLVVWLLGQPAWRLLYTDGTQTLFVHDEDGRFAKNALDLKSPATAHAIARELALRYGAQPLVLERARLHLARLLAEIGATGPADELLASLSGITAEALRARVAYLSGKPRRAEELARALLARAPNEIESLCLLAILARDRAEQGQARELIARALALDPFHPLARRLLGQMEGETGAGPQP